jgi:hypothetical protein
VRGGPSCVSVRTTSRIACTRTAEACSLTSRAKSSCGVWASSLKQHHSLIKRLSPLCSRGFACRCLCVVVMVGSALLDLCPPTWQASRVEEQFQIETYGFVYDGHDVDINFLRLRFFTYVVVVATTLAAHPC